jgi:hypothetical protein
MKRLILISIILAPWLHSGAQTGKQDLKREVTLYNPYKPSILDARKKSFLPNLLDTSAVKAQFDYKIIDNLYTPEYIISPIRAASLVPDPLPELHKSHVNFGLGNYLSSLAEVAITNERSKKAAMGVIARHFSSNGKLKLDNDIKAFAGYMDNNVSLFGKKFFRNNIVEGSVDFLQKTRHAYGYAFDYDTNRVYDPGKKEIKLGYNNLGASVSFSSVILDSSSFAYDLEAGYNYFFTDGGDYQHNIGLRGSMATIFRDFYAGSGLEFDFFGPPGKISSESRYLAGINPFLKKTSGQWDFKLGLRLMLDKDTASAKVHFYPDIAFGFDIVPAYIRFFATLDGKLEKNDPMKVTRENPFMIKDGSIFLLPNTSNPLVVSAGLKGNTGIEGNYLLSASYSLIDNLLLFSNRVFPDDPLSPSLGNYFLPLADDAELLRIHGEMTGQLTPKISYSGSINFYDYNLTNNEFAWNMPGWDGKMTVRYNLRDKIIAGAEVAALGRRKLHATLLSASLTPDDIIIDSPAHLNINISAEYRYTRILSFWVKLHNIAINRYYEWAYYPSRRFLCMIGFSYTL